MNPLFDESSNTFMPEDDTPQMRGVEHAGVIDAMTHDAGTDEVTLVMVEPRPWDGSELRLFQLQEKLNAYLSFALDGEMTEAYPVLEGKKLTLRLDCATMPDSMVVDFLKQVRDQIAFQEIDLQVRVAEGGAAPGSAAPQEGGAGGCGSGCGCGS